MLHEFIVCISVGLIAIDTLHDGDLLIELALLSAEWPHVPMEELLRMVTWTPRAIAGLPAALPPRRGQEDHHATRRPAHTRERERPRGDAKCRP